MISGGQLRVYWAEWPGDPFYNLAFEEAFYRSALLPSVRFWRNDRVVVIGRFQCAALEVNALEARRLGVGLVRRFTGGGAVYHDLGNLNYSILLPRSVASGIPEAFRLVGGMVVDALETLGVRGARYRPLNDIEVDGAKVSGLAASSSSTRILIHGAMLVSSNLSILARVLKVSPEKLSDKRFTPSRRSRVTTLEEELGRRVDPWEAARAILDVASERLGLEPAEAEASSLEAEAEKLYREKYSRPEWNLRYLPLLEDSLAVEEVEALKSIARPGGVRR